MQQIFKIHFQPDALNDKSTAGKQREDCLPKVANKGQSGRCLLIVFQRLKCTREKRKIDLNPL